MSRPSMKHGQTRAPARTRAPSAAAHRDAPGASARRRRRPVRTGAIAARPRAPLHRVHDRRMLEFAGRDQRIDAGDIHLHNAARADIQVPDFAVAHLTVGQSDKVLRGADQRVRKLASSLS